MRWMVGVMEDAVNRRLILVSGFAGDHATGVAVPVKTREVAARNLQPDAVPGQKYIRRSPQVDPKLIDFAWL